MKKEKKAIAFLVGLIMPSLGNMYTMGCTYVIDDTLWVNKIERTIAMLSDT